MRLVERMTGSPPNCLNCGKGNTPDEAGQVGPFIDLQREVNWDDDCYFCFECAEELGALAGMVSADDAKDLSRVNSALKRKVHDLKAEIEQRKRRESVAIRKARALEGAKA